MKVIANIDLSDFKSVLAKDLGFKLKNGSSFAVVLNLSTGDVSLTARGKLASNQMQVTTFKVKGATDKELDCSFNTQMRKVIFNYRENNLLCKTYAIKRFGKKLVNSISPCYEVRNPYYRCAPEMKFYDALYMTYKK